MAVDLRQTHFRFGKDDGTESGHTFWQLEDVNHSQLITADWAFLLRFTEQEAGGTAAGNTDAQFQYNRNGAGWVDITTTSSVVKAVAVGAFTNGQACTQRLSGTGTFETSGAGCTEDGSSGGPANDIAASGNSETEAGLQVVFADVANGDSIQFRFRSPDWTVTYDITPTLTIQKGAVQNLAGVSNGIAGVSGETKASRRVAGVAACVATASGATKVSKKISGVVACVGTTAGLIKVSRRLAGLVSGVASTTGSLTVTAAGVLLAGVVTGVASVTGLIKASRRFAGLSSGFASVSGGVKVTRRLAGAVSGNTSLSGAIKLLKTLAGIANCVCQVSGVTRIKRRIAGLTSGITSLTSNLSILRLRLLAGVVSSSASVAGILKVERYKKLIFTNVPDSLAFTDIADSLAFTRLEDSLAFTRVV